MWFAADSLLRLIECRRNLTLTSVRVDTTIISSEPWDTDDDVLKTMNLLFPLKGEKLAYPAFSFDTANPGERPMVLVVADSYYWNIFNTRIPKYVFANEAFWYFNALVYPEHYLRPSYTKNLNLRQEVEKQQVIFLMVTERFVHKFDWTFIDQLYAHYTPGWLRDPVYDKINAIIQVDPWYNDMIEKAVKKQVSLEDALITEAKFLYHQKDTLGYMVNYGLENFSQVIANDTGWMSYIRTKAEQQNKSEDEMLLADAAYIFNKKYHGLYELYQGLSATKERIYSSPAVLDSLKQEAEIYHFDLESFIRIKAWEIYAESEIQKTVENIRKDPSWYEHIKQKALKKGISQEEMIRLDAVYMWEQRLKKF